MREETRRRLDRTLRWRRIRTMGIYGGLALLLAAGWWAYADFETVASLEGELVAVRSEPGSRLGPPRTVFLVRLDDGRTVHATSRLAGEPKLHARLMLDDRRDLIGLHTYRAVAERSPAPAPH